jgi:hypothetical protein
MMFSEGLKGASREQALATIAGLFRKSPDEASLKAGVPSAPVHLR